MNRKYVVMTFDPSEGVELYGVFDSAALAVEWAERIGNWPCPWFVTDIFDYKLAEELA